jgi:hypothetical protein
VAKKQKVREQDDVSRREEKSTYTVRIPSPVKEAQESTNPFLREYFEALLKRHREEAIRQVEQLHVEKYRKLYLEAVERLLPEVRIELNALIAEHKPIFSVAATHHEREIPAEKLYLPDKGLAHLQKRVLDKLATPFEKALLG